MESSTDESAKVEQLSHGDTAMGEAVGHIDIFSEVLQTSFF